MGRIFWELLATAVLVVSCGLEEIGAEQDESDDVWLGPGNVVTGSGAGSQAGVGKKVWYAVGVDYPDDYDWRADENKGSVKCSLVVFANGVPMMKVPVGDRYEVSSDPDMHRMIGNDLYTDYSSDDETVIKKNGKSLFRYSGTEVILDMAVDGDDVYTLGHDRDGCGFTFRKNGHPLFERSGGYVFSRIEQGDDGWSFIFCELIVSGSETYERYFHYAAGEVTQVAVREDIKKVWDAVIYEGRVCYIASMVGIASPVLVAGDQMETLELPGGAEMVSCRFISDTKLSIEGVISQKGKPFYSGLWRGSDLVKTFSPGYTAISVCACEDDVSCVLNPFAPLLDGIIYRCGETLQIPGGYMSMGGRSMVMSDGILYVGLTPEIGSEQKSGIKDPAVWVDGEMKPLKINGFISHVTMY